MYFTLQNISEFWNVATRPIGNGRATMNVHGIRRILTFNTEVFARYEIEAIHPSTILTN